MILLPLLTLLLGILIGIVINVPVSGLLGNYLAICCIAAMDTIFGGVRSTLENRFRADIFVSGFFVNIFTAFFLAWLGDRIGLDLLLAIAIILGGRIFTNISLIRRYYIEHLNDKREKKSKESVDQA